MENGKQKNIIEFYSEMKLYTANNFLKDSLNYRYLKKGNRC